MTKHNELASAIESGDAARVAQLLTEHPDLANSPDWTPPPLHCAVLWNQPRVAEVLLDNGADIEIRDPNRQTTPLRYAIVYAKTEMIPLLLQRITLPRGRETRFLIVKRLLPRATRGCVFSKTALQRITLPRGRETLFSSVKRLLPRATRGCVFSKTALARGANAGAIIENGSTAMQLAIEAAAGAFDEYDDLPSRSDNAAIVRLLTELGVE